MHMHSERLSQVFTGWWRKKAVNDCPDVPEMWLYWQYTKGIEQHGSREASCLAEAENQKNEVREAS